MAARQFRPQTEEERLIYWAIVGTWGFWITGLLSLVAPVVGWWLCFRAVRAYVGLDPRREREGPADVPILAALWVLGMGVMAIALVAGHWSFDLDNGQLAKSLIGWAKGWALFGCLVLAGAVLPIRAEAVTRATNVLGAITLAIIPLLYGLYVAGAPSVLFVSPLQELGGGREFYEVSIYEIDPESGGVRFPLYAPWAPAAAYVACLSLVFALFERDKALKWVAIISAVTVCLLTRSRLAVVAIPAMLGALVVVPRLTKPSTIIMLALIAVLGSIALDPISAFLDDLTNQFTAARASSSRVRAVLQSIAVHRWAEAPIFGHGILERGGHIVEYMPIGSHHTWNGLLFVKGIVGLLALAIPLALTSALVVVKSQVDPASRLALALLIVTGLYSFGENLETLVYLSWPILIVIGTCLRRRTLSPIRSRFGLAPA